ncbi:MAG: AMIN domain-containing protein [Deltaproteobacteria bacterium]
MRVFSYRGRLGVKAVVLALAFATAFAGCASTGPMDISGAGGQASPAEKRQAGTAIESIDVVGEGDRVMISATGPVKYTVFRLSDPARLIVDLPGISTAEVPNATKVNNDFLNDIIVESYGGEERIGRIIIGLKDGIEHEVKSGENSLLVMFNKPAPPEVEAAAEPEVPAAEAAVPIETAPAAAVDALPEAEAPKASETAAKTEAMLATKITGVELSKSAKGASFRIKADGAIGSYNSFELDTPSRVIVDLWGVSNSSGKEFMNVRNKFVRAVRIGSHSDKVRLVFDSPGKALPVYNITKTDNSLVVAFGGEAASAKEKAALVQTALLEKPKDDILSKELAGNAAKAAPAAAQAVAAVAETEPLPSVEAATAPEKNQEEVKQEKPLIEVERIDYQGSGGKGRLTVVSTGKTAYTVKESEDGKTVVLDISGATIKDELVRTLDASKLNTPVLSISSYQQSAEPKDVRVLVMLADKSYY